MKTALLFLASSIGFAQINALTVGEVPPIRLKVGQSGDVKLPLQLKAGYHVQSNMPAEAYLIPLKVTWNPGPLTPGAITYPKPKMEKYAFDEMPLSVFTEDFIVTTSFTAPATAPAGLAIATGK